MPRVQAKNTFSIHTNPRNNASSPPLYKLTSKNQVINNPSSSLNLTNKLCLQNSHHNLIPYNDHNILLWFLTTAKKHRRFLMWARNTYRPILIKNSIALITHNKCIKNNKPKPQLLYPSSINTDSLNNKMECKKTTYISNKNSIISISLLYNRKTYSISFIIKITHYH